MSDRERRLFQPKRLEVDMEESTRVGTDGMAAVVGLLRDERGSVLAEVAHPVELHITRDADKIEAFSLFVRELAAAPEMYEALRQIGNAYGHLTGEDCAEIAFAAMPKVEKGNHDGS